MHRFWRIGGFSARKGSKDSTAEPLIPPETFQHSCGHISSNDARSSSYQRTCSRAMVVVLVVTVTFGLSALVMLMQLPLSLMLLHGHRIAFPDLSAGLSPALSASQSSDDDFAFATAFRKGKNDAVSISSTDIDDVFDAAAMVVSESARAISDSFTATTAIADTAASTSATSATPTSTAASSTYVPTVLLHGLGDASGHAGMSELCESVRAQYTGMYVVCSDVADGFASLTTHMQQQVSAFAAAVAADPHLRRGFNAVGLSQGALVLRAYVEQVNDPPVRRLVSVCGPQAGISQCPQPTQWLCALFGRDPYDSAFAFSDYWKNAADKATYLARSRWLADVNNERDAQNTEYRQKMASLHRYVLVHALQDSVLVPRASATHGFWEWGHVGVEVQMRQTDGYRDDAIGLRSLDRSGRLFLHGYDGDHLRFNRSFWRHGVLQHLNDTWVADAEIDDKINAEIHADINTKGNA